MRYFGFLLLAASSLFAYQPQDGQQTYNKLCAGCHGDDARGSQQGPGLAGNASLRRRTPLSIRNVIVRGIPAAGMPGFDLPAAVLDDLVAMVRSLNAAAAETNVPGDRAAGREFFFGKGKCSTCHMAQGAGSPVGPDLSAAARERTVDQLRESLVNPSARIAPGYALSNVRLRDGKTLRGFIRSCTSYDLALQDLSGVLHPLSMDRVAKIEEEKSSWMPALSSSAEETQNLLAFLSKMEGVSPKPSALPGGLDFASILQPKPGDWVTYNGNVSGNRRSPLTQINASNIGKLSLKWTYSVPLWAQFLPDTPYFHENMRYFGLETVPVVAGGIVYVTGPNQVMALDPKTGAEIWRYFRPRTPGLVSDPSLGTNRGVALLGDNVFFVTDNAHLLALNRITGRLVWEVTMPHEAQKYGGTIAPLIVKNLVIAGVAGGDWGIRGFLAAYKASNGELAWKHWTVPDQGEPGIETWKGTAYKLGGGGTWLTGSYDPSTDTLFWATGNPWPNSDDRERGGDNLYTDSVLALDPATGKRKWHFQFTPHDTHDWDSNTPLVVADAMFQGQQRKLLLHADRNGFFYVLDRVTGKMLLAKSFMKKLTWASGIDANGRPVMNPPAEVNCPEHATNWNGTAYSPVTKLYYVMATERCTVKLAPGSWKNPQKVLPPEDPGQKFLRAIDIETGRIAWEVPQVGPVDGKRVAGILNTASGLLFYGDPSGYFVVADERDGKTLWRIPLNATMKTSPMTYAVDGEQYVSIAVGSTIMTFGLAK